MEWDGGLQLGLGHVEHHRGAVVGAADGDDRPGPLREGRRRTEEQRGDPPAPVGDLATLIPRSGLQVWTMAQAMRLLPKLPGALQRRLTSFGGGPAAMLNGVELRDPLTLRT